MNIDKGRFTEQMIVFPPVIGMAPVESVPLHDASGRGKFETLTRAYPPVIGLEHLNLRLRIQVPPVGDAPGLILRTVEEASEMDRSLGGKGLTKLAQDANGETVVVVLGSVDPIGGDERIGTIVLALNKRSGAERSPLVTAETV